jgi:DNA-binding LacI/PurR family transcriptional regulator
MRKIARGKSQPFYEQLKDMLRKQIASGRLKVGAALPDEVELAAETGVSFMTVRRAVVELSKEGLLERIRGRGTFVRGAFSAPRARTQKGTIAIVAPYNEFEVSGAQFYHRMLQGIQGSASTAGLPLVFKKVTRPYDSFVASLRLDRTLTGLIIMGLCDQDLLKLLAQVPLPAVLLDSVQPEGAIAFDEVNHASEEGAFQATTALISYGHRDVGLIISHLFSPFFQQRKDGFERALRERGLTLRPEFIYNVGFTSREAYAGMRQALQKKDVPTALFCASDELAIGAMAAIVDHGGRVPRDMSIAGFGDIGFFTSPALSSVRMPIEEMGRTAMQILAERLSQPGAAPKRIILPTEWISRASCDVPRNDKFQCIES